MLKHNNIKKILSLIVILLLIGQKPVLPIDNQYNNQLLKLNINKSGDDGSVSLKLYTSKPYPVRISPIKKSSDEYVIYLPETYHSITSKPDFSNCSNYIKDLDVKLVPYSGSSSNNGYTKIIVKTSFEDVRLNVSDEITNQTPQLQQELTNLLGARKKVKIPYKTLANKPELRTRKQEAKKPVSEKAKPIAKKSSGNKIALKQEAIIKKQLPAKKFTVIETQKQVIPQKIKQLAPIELKPAVNKIAKKTEEPKVTLREVNNIALSPSQKDLSVVNTVKNKHNIQKPQEKSQKAVINMPFEKQAAPKVIDLVNKTEKNIHPVTLPEAKPVNNALKTESHVVGEKNTKTTIKLVENAVSSANNTVSAAVNQSESVKKSLIDLKGLHPPDKQPDGRLKFLMSLIVPIISAFGILILLVRVMKRMKKSQDNTPIKINTDFAEESQEEFESIPEVDEMGEFEESEESEEEPFMDTTLSQPTDLIAQISKAPNANLGTNPIKTVSYTEISPEDLETEEIRVAAPVKKAVRSKAPEKDYSDELEFINGIEVEGNKGFYLVKADQNIALIGLIEDEVILLNAFENIANDKFIVRKTSGDDNDPKEVYFVQVGTWCALVSSEGNSMNIDTVF